MDLLPASTSKAAVNSVRIGLGFKVEDFELDGYTLPLKNGIFFGGKTLFQTGLKNGMLLL